MRMSSWEDFALPLTFVFAVVFALTLHREISLPSPATEAAAAQVAPHYVMTITAKRLPAECRNAAAPTAACARLLAGDARVEMRESSTRLADRAPDRIYAY